jgi:hypothetical protein
VDPLAQTPILTDSELAGLPTKIKVDLPPDPGLKGMLPKQRSWADFFVGGFVGVAVSRIQHFGTGWAIDRAMGLGQGIQGLFHGGRPGPGPGTLLTGAMPAWHALGASVASSVGQGGVFCLYVGGITECGE